MLNLLLSKDTSSEAFQRLQDRTYSLFSDLAKRPENTDLDELEIMRKAQAIVYGNMGLGVPPTSTAGETIDLEVSE